MNIRPFRGFSPQVTSSCYVDPTATLIGQVTLGEDVSIWPNVVVRGDVNSISIGDRTNIQDNTVCHVNHPADFNPGGDPLVIGHDVTVGHRALLHGCTIEDQCLVGMGAIVMDKAVVQSQVIIGAGTLVSPNKVLQSGYLYVGSPARQIRELTDDEKSFILYSAKHYAKLKNDYST